MITVADPRASLPLPAAGTRGRSHRGELVGLLGLHRGLLADRIEPQRMG